MGEHSQAVDVDPQELKKAQEMWHSFACVSKTVVVVTCVVLILLALVFIDFT
ncbi:MAG: aa3-type cytochrome c oxidase subunit IV [Alphaproteobacteria bacterium]|nr:aa3-type cytochrome c oxidase subunit IV [Alphaproteobacteria bacterium]QQS58211.1 MAG: aa3-type cytochrome c oxidase subunit IV [Alphaproteobacteria bacterium]